MNCQEIQGLLDEALDGELSETARRAFDTHTASCQECARRFEFGHRMKQLVAHRARMPEPSAYLGEKLRRALAQASQRQSYRSRWRQIAAAAALLCIAGLGYFVFSRMPSNADLMAALA